MAEDALLAPILEPGTPRWVVAMLTASPKRGLIGRQVAMTALAAASFAIAATLFAGGGGVAALGLLFVLLPFVAFAAAWRSYRHSVVLAGSPMYEGVAITGAGLGMLADIQGRFDYAKRMIDEVPTGIDWSEIEADVAALLWDAAGHAARVAALDAEVGELRYAATGTPQAALKRRLEERREEHWQVLADSQREADSLARVAGNAAAAAKVALARTGSIAALEVAAPTARAVLARGALEQARARLVLLADVWAELDDSTDLLAERLGLAETESHGEARPRDETGLRADEGGQ